MQIFDLIQSRRTVHTYCDEKVPPAILQKAIQAAIYAPNHKLTWPWRFFYLGPVARAQLADAQVEIQNKKSPLTEIAKKAVFEKFTKSGELLLAAIVKTEDPKRSKEDYAAMAAGLQNFALYLWSEGYGTKWSTGGIIQHAVVNELLAGVNSNQEPLEVCGMIWVGKAATVPAAPERPPVEKFYFKID